jgi:hypothetical protein
LRAAIRHFRHFRQFCLSFVLGVLLAFSKAFGDFALLFIKRRCMKGIMTTLQTARAVIDALGGTTMVARLTRRKPQHVTNWKASGRLPAETFLTLKQALAKKELEASSRLWGITEPSEAEAED